MFGKMVRHQRPRRNTLHSDTITVAKKIIMLYVNNGALCFGSRRDMEKGTSIAERHMRRFGLKMHLGDRKDTRSKTEFIYIPAIISTRNIIEEHMWTKCIKDDMTNVLVTEEDKPKK